MSEIENIKAADVARVIQEAMADCLSIDGKEIRGTGPASFKAAHNILIRLTAALSLSRGEGERGDLPQGDGEPCYYCGKPCSAIAGDTGLWPIPLCHSDDPGVAKWHHTRCVTERLIENCPSPDATAIREECAQVEVTPDIANEAAAENDFQCGYVVGFQDCDYRMRDAIRSLNLGKFARTNNAG